MIADLFEEAAEARAEEYGIPESGGVATALNHPDVEIVVNLTIPAAHVEVATAAVSAGKHVGRKAVLPDRDQAGPVRGRRRGAPAGQRPGHLGAGLRLPGG